MSSLLATCPKKLLETREFSVEIGDCLNDSDTAMVWRHLRGTTKLICDCDSYSNWTQFCSRIKHYSSYSGSLENSCNEYIFVYLVIQKRAWWWSLLSSNLRERIRIRLSTTLETVRTTWFQAAAINRRRKRSPAWSLLCFASDDVTGSETVYKNQYMIVCKRKFSNLYPNMPSSIVALYWEGISIKAARANSACFLDGSTSFDIISVKLTNWTEKSLEHTSLWLPSDTFRIRQVTWEVNAVISFSNWMAKLLLTWKLSNALAGMLSSNSLIMSQGPSPTPTRTIDNG